ncbi:MAG: aminotransferase class I/II-fold pyridoxal phosphate-dependent enzyme [Thermoanaerobaculia bacterium]|nr:aminotransferase class I/II-fold pyridoxal phosphate-dependent enzyme [Thermoanaerobaculia bacterium]
MSDLEAVNSALREASPALFEALSPLGRRVAFPPDIPFQAAQARGVAYNGTIGQITDGRGGAVALPSIERALAGLGGEDLDRAVLYSPVEGIPEARRLWRAWQRRGQPEERVSTLPVVTVGLTHGLSIAADLFGGEGRAIAVPSPFWGNSRQTFANRTGAVMKTAPAYRGGRYDPEWPRRALADLPPGEPAVAIVNLPSNPGGYSVTPDEDARLREALLAEADRRPLVVVCDDAYAGLVFEPEAMAESIFWRLAGVHPSLVPVKVDGATKEISFFGARVGFVTFAFAEGSPAAQALESKVKCLTRAALGSPVAATQVLLLQALRDDTLETQVAEVRALLGRRYRRLREALAGVDRALLRPLPFNSGCFALLEIPEELGIDSESVRRHLLAQHDAGVISIAPRYLRIAFCSVGEEALPELVARIEAGVRDLA